MINIRQRIKELLEKYGHDIVYIRRDERFHCECYVERSGEADPNCPKCFGTGYEVSIEKQRTRRAIASVPETLIGVNQLQPIGSLAPKAYVYYFEHFVNPTENDLILEVIWDVNGIPRHIKNKYLISATDAQLGFKGRTEFHQIYCRFDQKGDNDDQALSQH